MTPPVVLPAGRETPILIVKAESAVEDRLDRDLREGRYDAIVVRLSEAKIRRLLKTKSGGPKRHLQSSIGSRATPERAGVRRSSVDRWASFVAQACTATDDIRTLGAWARHLGVGTTTLSESCRLIGIKPQSARDLTRAVLAVMRAAKLQCAPHVLLDVADARTLRTFVQKAGPDFKPVHEPKTLEAFLGSQSFVDRHNHGIETLRQLLTEYLFQSVA